MPLSEQQLIQLRSLSIRAFQAAAEYQPPGETLAERDYLLRDYTKAHVDRDAELFTNPIPRELRDQIGDNGLKQNQAYDIFYFFNTLEIRARRYIHSNDQLLAYLEELDSLKKIVVRDYILHLQTIVNEALEESTNTETVRRLQRFRRTLRNLSGETANQLIENLTREFDAHLRELAQSNTSSTLRKYLGTSNTWNYISDMEPRFSLLNRAHRLCTAATRAQRAEYLSLAVDANVLAKPYSERELATLKILNLECIRARCEKEHTKLLPEHYAIRDKRIDEMDVNFIENALGFIQRECQSLNIQHHETQNLKLIQDKLYTAKLQYHLKESLSTIQSFAQHQNGPVQRFLASVTAKLEELQEVYEWDTNPLQRRDYYARLSYIMVLLETSSKKLELMQSQERAVGRRLFGQTRLDQYLRGISQVKNAIDGELAEITPQLTQAEAMFGVDEESRESLSALLTSYANVCRNRDASKASTLFHHAELSRLNRQIHDSIGKATRSARNGENVPVEEKAALLTYLTNNVRFLDEKRKSLNYGRRIMNGLGEKADDYKKKYGSSIMGVVIGVPVGLVCLGLCSVASLFAWLRAPGKGKLLTDLEKARTELQDRLSTQIWTPPRPLPSPANTSDS